jgi:hypothetical protein
MATLPVFAAVGTVAITFLPELTLKAEAFTPPNVTFVVPMNPDPVIVTFVPIGPVVGVKLVIAGRTLKIWLLFKAPDAVFTVT